MATSHLQLHASMLHAVISINQKKKKMPNQFSKKLVALPLAGFLSLQAS